MTGPHLTSSARRAARATDPRGQQRPCRWWGGRLGAGLTLVLAAALLVPRALADADAGGTSEPVFEAPAEFDGTPDEMPAVPGVAGGVEDLGPYPDVAAWAQSQGPAQGEGGAGGPRDGPGVPGVAGVATAAGEDASWPDRTPVAAAWNPPEGQQPRDAADRGAAVADDPGTGAPGQPERAEQDERRVDVPGCAGDGCPKAPPMPGSRPGMAAISGGGGAGGGSSGDSEGPRSLNDRIWDLFVQIADLRGQVREVRRSWSDAQRAEYDRNQQAALEGRLAEEGLPPTREAIVAELRRIAEQFQRLEAQVVGEGTPQDRQSLEAVRDYVRLVLDEWQGRAMSIVELAPPGTPGQPTGGSGRVVSGIPSLGTGSTPDLRVPPRLTTEGGLVRLTPAPAGSGGSAPRTGIPPSRTAADVGPVVKVLVMTGVASAAVAYAFVKGMSCLAACLATSVHVPRGLLPLSGATPG
ncbi:MAG TPA: hypothetical protein VKG45_03275 [Actinomycetes bacterium]|nr:hypothetical protein [Actinomycetes bacterium]